MSERPNSPDTTASDGDERRETAGYRGWGGPTSTPTTLVLVRHGVTAHTVDKRFSGGLGGSDPALSEEGREQAEAAADWLAALRPDALISSPVLRARQTAAALARSWGCEIEERPAFAEIDFGRWEGLTFAEAQQAHPEEVTAWLGSLDVAPGGGGESFRQVRERVLHGLADLVGAHPGGTVVVVSHVTPIKVLIAHALAAPLESIYRMELSPASVSVIAAHAAPERDGAGSASLRLFNALPGAAPFSAG